MSSESSTAEAQPVRRRDLRKQHTSSRVPSVFSKQGATSVSQNSDPTPSAPLSPRRAAMAAEARATAGSPRRAAMAREAEARPDHGGSAFVAARMGSRGSDGSLLRSVRRRRVTTFSALATVSVTGTAIAAVMVAGNMSGNQEVKVDETAADSQTRAINSESVSADIKADDEKTSMAIGAPSAKQTKVEAASRAITKTVLPGCEGEAPKGDASNGEVPDEWLCEIGVGNHKLRSDAAVSFAKMNAAFKKDTGKELAVTDSYRSLESQISVAERKPGFAARPGTSNHGWGIALDLGAGTQNGTGVQYDWLVANADKYGWENPDWAQRNSYELWHWEYVPGRKDLKGA
ncbi:M15 family metallopeptidase [Brevibacterium aurantiacum]|uniref:M15 family metallopeptidase n=1 Tax=Brevibacterium aurantiacum TaxID=273384 RepID=UPI00265310DB|nr:M15 family metallopeptidase [Brevibacterium aurantiacum]